MKTNNFIKISTILTLVLAVFCVGCESKPETRSDNTRSHMRGGEPRDFEDMYKGYIAMKKDYLQENIGLEPADTAEFFSVYEQMQRERMGLQHKLRDEFREVSYLQIDTLSDDECLEMALRINTAPIKESEIRSKYFQVFKEMLTPQQLLRLEIAEIKFNNHLLRQRRGDGGERKGIR